LDDVANNPGAYREILLPWQDWPDADPPQWEEVFAKQKQHWWEFRQWQALNRTKGPPTIVRDGPHVDVYIVFYRHFRRTSPNYAEALKKLLGQYGFTVVCQLHDDPAHQDELTTWVEYLGYACAAHYRHNRLVERSQPKYDEAWKALVNIGVLRPSEAQEYLHDIMSAFDHQAEEEQARQAAELAESAVNEITRKSHGAPGNAEQTLQWELAAAQSALDAARRRLESTRRRNRLVTNFIVSVRGYTEARRVARRCYAVMQWILGQVPLVAAEVKKPGTVSEGGVSPRHDDGSSGRDEEPLGGKQSPEQMGHEESAHRTGGRAASHTRARSAHGRADSDDTEGDGSRSERAGKNIDVGIVAATVPEQPSSCQQEHSAPPVLQNSA
jgi:polyhydroxyalkanoate synthesis regulator phasin